MFAPVPFRRERRVPDHLNTVFFGLSDKDRFYRSFQEVLASGITGNVFTGDNLFTFGKNLGFLSDTKFMKVFAEQATDHAEKAAVWRTHTLCWAAGRALRLPGDFVECGSYRGTSARILAGYLDFAAVDKTFTLFDVFDDIGQIDQHGYPAMAGGIHEAVMARFADFPNVHAIKGFVPEILAGNTPEEISFLHIDMNNAKAERAALEILFDHVTPGGSVVLDDYGWRTYADQKREHDAFFESRGYQVLELPTGQGLVIK
jgi:O-methyltransferase